MTNQIIETGTCDHCLEDNISVIFMNQGALRARICLNCLSVAANILYRSKGIHGQKSKEWIVSNVLSARTGQPRIDIQSPSMDAPTQMSVKEAIDLALILISVAEVSKLDAIFNDWMIQSGMGDQERAIMIHQFREIRNKNNDYE